MNVLLMFLKSVGFPAVVFDWFENVAPFSVHAVSGFSPVVVPVLKIPFILSYSSKCVNVASMFVVFAGMQTVFIVPFFG